MLHTKRLIKLPWPVPQFLHLAIETKRKGQALLTSYDLRIRYFSNITKMETCATFRNRSSTHLRGSGLWVRDRESHATMQPSNHYPNLSDPVSMDHGIFI